MAYKIASDKKQAALRRPTPKRFGDFDIDPKDHERAENLKVMKEKLEAELRNCFVPQRKKELGIQINELNQQIRLFKPPKRYGRDFANYLCDVIKQEVTPAQWKIWVKKAEELAEPVPPEQALDESEGV